MRSGLAACLVGLGIAASGCFGPGCWNDSGGTMRWTDPGLFGGMPRDGSYDEFRVARIKPEPGLPFADAGLDDTWGPDNWSLLSVTWEWSGASHSLEAPPALGPSGVLTIGWLSDLEDAVVANLVKSVAENLTDLDSAARGRAAAEFLANRSGRGDVYTEDPATGAPALKLFFSSIDLSGSLVLTEAWTRLRLEEQASSDLHSPPGQGPWRFGFRLVYAVAESTASEAGWRLTVSPTGDASLEAGGRDSTDADIRATMDKALDALGLVDDRRPSVAFDRQRICT